MPLSQPAESESGAGRGSVGGSRPSRAPRPSVAPPPSRRALPPPSRSSCPPPLRRLPPPPPAPRRSSPPGTPLQVQSRDEVERCSAPGDPAMAPIISATPIHSSIAPSASAPLEAQTPYTSLAPAIVGHSFVPESDAFAKSLRSSRAPRAGYLALALLAGILTYEAATHAKTLMGGAHWESAVTVVRSRLSAASAALEYSSVKHSHRGRDADTTPTGAVPPGGQAPSAGPDPLGIVRAVRRIRIAGEDPAPSSVPVISSSGAGRARKLADFEVGLARRAIEELSPALARCPGWSGASELLVNFAPSGSVRAVLVVAGSIKREPEAAACAISTLRRASVPPYRGGPVTVSVKLERP